MWNKRLRLAHVWNDVQLRASRDRPYHRRGHPPRLPTLLAERRNDYSSSSASTTPAVTATTGFRVASPNETRRDLSALRDMVAQQAGTPAILITPPPAAHTIHHDTGVEQDHRRR
mgnify:CR=1 FL=1